MTPLPLSRPSVPRNVTRLAALDGPYSESPVCDPIAAAARLPANAPPEPPLPARALVVEVDSIEIRFGDLLRRRHARLHVGAQLRNRFADDVVLHVGLGLLRLRHGRLRDFERLPVLVRRRAVGVVEAVRRQRGDAE